MPTPEAGRPVAGHQNGNGECLLRLFVYREVRLRITSLAGTSMN